MAFGHSSQHGQVRQLAADGNPSPSIESDKHADVKLEAIRVLDDGVPPPLNILRPNPNIRHQSHSDCEAVKCDLDCFRTKNV